MSGMELLFSLLPLLNKLLLLCVLLSCCVGAFTRYQGVSRRCRLSWLTNSDLVYEPKCKGGGWSTGSHPMDPGAQINFGDLTPYLTYVR
jgi:hypothetical protein